MIHNDNEILYVMSVNNIKVLKADSDKHTIALCNFLFSIYTSYIIK